MQKVEKELQNPYLLSYAKSTRKSFFVQKDFTMLHTLKWFAKKLGGAVKNCKNTNTICKKTKRNCKIRICLPMLSRRENRFCAKRLHDVANALK